MTFANIEGPLSFANTESKSIDLRSAKISGILDMTGTKVNELLNMDKIIVQSSCFMREHAEFHDVVLRSAHILGQLSIRDVIVKGELNLNGANIESGLMIRENTELKGVDLRSATIKNQVTMFGIKIHENLFMNSTIVKGHLLINEFDVSQNFELRTAVIQGQLSMTDVDVKGLLNMNGITVNNGLLIRGKSFLKTFDLSNATLTGQLEIIGATFLDFVTMESITVSQNLFLILDKFQNEIDLMNISVEGNLLISGKSLQQINLSGASIKGELNLGYGLELPIWKEESRIILRNTKVGAINDAGEKAWPVHLDLQGFSYHRLGGITDQENFSGNFSIANRPALWFTSWLEKDEAYSPQPYHQLAKVLNDMGQSDKANTILYAGKNRELRESWKAKKIGKWIWLSLLRWTIGYGYGYRYFFSLWWVVAITTFGVYVLSTLGDATPSLLTTIGSKIAFSLDMLLPIIELNDEFKIKIVTGWQLYYFYFHELMGFLLGSFVVAGLSGITKK
ncbi:MAG: hypothetical protein L0Y80_11545 [Ignavibacteriae bacterium]|nr:hypothetical protein [Ignavibacteriota bacterium]